MEEIEWKLVQSSSSLSGDRLLHMLTEQRQRSDPGLLITAASENPFWESGVLQADK